LRIIGKILHWLLKAQRYECEPQNLIYFAAPHENLQLFPQLTASSACEYMLYHLFLKTEH